MVFCCHQQLNLVRVVQQSQLREEALEAIRQMGVVDFEPTQLQALLAS
jgi:hypothetical protein